jgi:hypothetical protein
MELVTHLYLVKQVKGISVNHAKRVLRNSIKKTNTNPREIATYRKADADKVIAQYREAMRPIGDNEVDRKWLEKYFQVGHAKLSKIIEREDFPAVKRRFTNGLSGGYVDLWDIEDIKRFNTPEFQASYVKRIKRGHYKIQEKPIIYTGSQLDFIKICRPGGLLASSFA